MIRTRLTKAHSPSSFSNVRLVGPACTCTTQTKHARSTNRANIIATNEASEGWLVGERRGALFAGQGPFSPPARLRPCTRKGTGREGDAAEPPGRTGATVALFFLGQASPPTRRRKGAGASPWRCTGSPVAGFRRKRFFLFLLPEHVGRTPEYGQKNPRPHGHLQLVCVGL
jgi:hypothetical protein